MPTLKDELISSFGDGFDKKAENILNNNFLNTKDSWVRRVTDEYVRYNTDPNQTISKIAAENNLNDEQVKRIVEESNVSIYLKKYAQVKNYPTRDVKFPLADASKICTSTEVTKAAEAVEGVPSLDKAASYAPGAAFAAAMVFTSGDAPAGDCFTTSASNDFSLWEKSAAEKDLVKKLSRRKIGAHKLDTFEKEAKDIQLGNKLGVIGNSLIYNARSLGNTQNLMDKIASDASLDIRAQQLILDYVNTKVSLNKEARILPGNFELNLKAYTSESNPFSLGAHSLTKSAGDVVINVDKLPENVDYDDLVSFAREIKKELNENPPSNTFKPIYAEEVKLDATGK